MGICLYDLEKMIDTIEYVKVGVKTTVCVLTVKGGFEIVGTSACVDPKAFVKEEGESWARKGAMDKLWEYAAFNASLNIEDCPLDPEFERLQRINKDLEEKFTSELRIPEKIMISDCIRKNLEAIVYGGNIVK